MYAPGLDQPHRQIVLGKREREGERGAIKQGQGQRVRARDRVRSGVGFGHLDDQVVLVRPGQSVGVQGVVRGGQFWYD